MKLRVVFVTHLHSDHTVGYPDLILTPWVLGRRVPLEVYGPRGIKQMTEHVLAAYSEDFAARTRDRELYTVGAFPEGHAVNAHEIKPGVVYKDANVTVTAFATKHTMESFGFRFDAPDRSIVISGDTNPTQATIDACNGCDVLIHEVLSHDWLVQAPDFHAYAARHHTTTSQLVRAREQGEAQTARAVSRLDFLAAGGRQPAVDGGDAAERDGEVYRPRGGGTRPGCLLTGGAVGSLRRDGDAVGDAIAGEGDDGGAFGQAGADFGEHVVAGADGDRPGHRPPGLDREHRPLFALPDERADRHAQHAGGRRDDDADLDAVAVAQLRRRLAGRRRGR